MHSVTLIRKGVCVVTPGNNPAKVLVIADVEESLRIAGELDKKEVEP